MTVGEIESALLVHRNAHHYRLGGYMLRYGNTTNHTEILRYLRETDEQELIDTMEKINEAGEPSPLSWVTTCKPGKDTNLSRSSNVFAIFIWCFRIPVDFERDLQQAG